MQRRHPPGLSAAFERGLLVSCRVEELKPNTTGVNTSRGAPHTRVWAVPIRLKEPLDTVLCPDR